MIDLTLDGSPIKKAVKPAVKSPELFAPRPVAIEPKFVPLRNNEQRQSEWRRTLAYSERRQARTADTRG